MRRDLVMANFIVSPERRSPGPARTHRNTEEMLIQLPMILISEAAIFEGLFNLATLWHYTACPLDRE